MVGRMACGLPITNTDFALLPPRFWKPDGNDVLTADQWRLYVPGWDQLPACFKGTVPYLLASVVYHRTWLKENLSAQHPLFQSLFWKDRMPDQLAPFVLAGKFRCDKTMMVASGLPSHLMLSQRIEVVEAQLALFQKVVHELHVEVMEILPMAVAKEVLAHVTVNGAVAVTSADLVALRADITKSISTSLESFLQQMGSKGVTQSASDPSLSMSAG